MTFNTCTCARALRNYVHARALHMCDRASHGSNGALRAHLAKQTHTEGFSTLSDVKEFVEARYPSLNVEQVETSGFSQWVIAAACSAASREAQFSSEDSYTLEVRYTRYAR